MVPSLPWETGPLASILGSAWLIPLRRQVQPLDVARWLGDEVRPSLGPPDKVVPVPVQEGELLSASKDGMPPVQEGLAERAAVEGKWLRWLRGAAQASTIVQAA